MSAKAVFWAFENMSKVKDGTAIALLLKLADQANDDGIAWPSRSTLAVHLGVSTRTISGAAQRLEKAGLILRNPRLRTNGSRASNVYQLLLETDDKGDIEAGDKGGGARESRMPPEPTQKESQQRHAAAATRAKYDSLWEAFIAAGINRPATKAEKGKLNAAVRQLVEIDADPAEIAPRAKVYLRNYPAIGFTALGLVGHWSESDPKRRMGPSPLLDCPECQAKGIQTQLTVMAWKEHRYMSHEVGTVCKECGGVVMPDRRDTCPCGLVSSG